MDTLKFKVENTIINNPDDFMYDIYYLEIILEIHFEQHLISNNIHRHFSIPFTAII